MGSDKQAPSPWRGIVRVRFWERDGTLHDYQARPSQDRVLLAPLQCAPELGASLSGWHWRDDLTCLSVEGDLAGVVGIHVWDADHRYCGVIGD